MPSVNDIVQVAEALEKSPVAVIQDRCLAVRNRNSSCRRCTEACIADAIDIVGNELYLDASACVSCGVCTSVCPTEALAPLKPTDSELADAMARSAAGNDGVAVIVCARMAAKRLSDPALYAEVPCLGRMEESLLVALVSKGASQVFLVDGTCGTCKYGACSEFVNDIVRSANALATAMGSSVHVVRTSSMPEFMLADSTEGLIGSTRRGFFREAAGAARETALTAAKTTLSKELGLGESPATIGERLRVDEDGLMPQLNMPRHDVLINAMDAIGSPVTESLESRRFANVEIDAGKCNACGMCVVFCPTRALRRDIEGADVRPSVLKAIEFSAADCVQCGLCADVCWKGALVVSPTVSTSQLFDFEPVTFVLNAQQNSQNRIFGN